MIWKTRRSRSNQQDYPGCEYHGHAGGTRQCLEAIAQLLSGPRRIQTARLLSSGGEHGWRLTDQIGDAIYILPGFASGYVGEGSRGLAQTILLFDRHNIQMDEVEISREAMERFERSNFLTDDLRAIETSRVITHRIWDYVSKNDIDGKLGERVWSEVAPTMPFGIVHSTLFDLALTFFEAPEDRLQRAYRRLEDCIRDRTGLTGVGSKLFQSAFEPDQARLVLPGDADRAEQVGLSLLFRGLFQVHRNPSAHSEKWMLEQDALSEFLALNHLFRLLDLLADAKES